MKIPGLLALMFVGLAFAQTPRRPRITGVAHVAFYTSDVNSARKFYKDLLGYAEPFDLKNPDGTLSLTFIKINDHQYVELFPERQPNSDRLAHVSVETEDIDALREYLAAKGIKVPDKVTTGRIGNRSLNVTDPDGHTVEFVQYMPTGWSLRDQGKFLGPNRVSDRMAHFGILVGALEPAMKFYRDILGFQEIWRGSRNPDRLDWVNMRVPDGDEYVEFMLYTDLPEPAKRGTQHHICLFVTDMNKALENLTQRAAQASYTRSLEIRTGINRRRQLNLYDPDGTRVELMEDHTVDGKPAPSSSAPPPH